MSEKAKRKRTGKHAAKIKELIERAKEQHRENLREIFDSSMSAWRNNEDGKEIGVNAASLSSKVTKIDWGMGYLAGLQRAHDALTGSDTKQASPLVKNIGDEDSNG